MGIITIRQYKNIFLINRTDKGIGVLEGHAGMTIPL